MSTTLKRAKNECSRYPCCDKPMKRATEVALDSARQDQLRVWSTSLFLAIQGIMARS